MEVRVTDEELKVVYDDIPKSYDRANRLMSFNQDVKWRAELVKSILTFNSSPKTVLDVASGKGELSYVFKKFKKDVEPILLDYSENMLKSSLINGERVQGSFDALPFRDDVFDVVMSSFALHASDDIEQAVKEMARVSKGLVGFIAMGKPDSKVKRLYLGIYLHFIMPYISFLAGGRPRDYKFIFYIFKKLYPNSFYKSLFSKLLQVMIYKEKSLNLFYFVIGNKLQIRS
ncbi:MAG: class I SAM-dependent methyltransferase [Metallosphaera sp.]